MSKPRRPGPKRKTNSCSDSPPTARPSSKTSLHSCPIETPRCATAGIGDSPTSPRTAGVGQKTRNWPRALNYMEKNGDNSPLSFRVNDCRLRSQLQAVEGPLRELSASEPGAGGVEGIGRPASDRTAESTRQELEVDRAGHARAQSQPAQESFLRQD
jgi:hypothetical protein